MAVLPDKHPGWVLVQMAPRSWGWGVPWGLPCLSQQCCTSVPCGPPELALTPSGAQAVFPSRPSRTGGDGGGTSGWQMLPLLSTMQKK